MTRTVFAALTAALFIPVGGAALADPPASPAATSMAAPSQVHGAKKGRAQSPDDVICKNLPEPGSRLSSERMCMTRREWVQQSNTARDLLMGSHPGGGMPK